MVRGNLFSSLKYFKKRGSNFLTVLLVALFLLVLVFAIYSSRWIFFYRYEPSYYEDWYYHSQWVYPQSARGISDGELYKFVGYRLTFGENPFDINFEIPPLGKLLYGYFSRFLGNPYFLSLIYLFLLFFVFGLLLLQIFERKTIFVFMGLVLFSLIPHLTNQIKETMLDLPLTLFYSVHILFLIYFLKRKYKKYLFLSGFFLGLASSIKPPFFTPIIFLFETIVLLRLRFNFLVISDLFLTCLLGYFSGYFTYFLKHPNPIPFLKLHKKIFDFYHPQTVLSPNFSLIINELINWGSWSGVYFLGFIGLILLSIRLILGERVKTEILAVMAFSWALIFGLSTLSSFPSRYVLPLSFCFVTLSLKVFPRKIILIGILFSLPFFWNTFDPHTPYGDAQSFARFTQTRAYKELYRSISPEDRKKISEEDFEMLLENFYQKLGTRSVEVSILGSVSFPEKYLYPVEIRYITRYGIFKNRTDLEFKKVRNQWKLDWNWDYVYQGFKPGLDFEIEKKPSNGYKNYEVYVIPDLISDLSSILFKLSHLTGIDVREVNSHFTSFVPDRYERFVGFLRENVSQEEVEELKDKTDAIRIREVLIDDSLLDKENALMFNYN